MPNAEMSDSDHGRYRKECDDIERHMGWSPGTVQRIITGGDTHPYDRDPVAHLELVKHICTLTEGIDHVRAALQRP
jgi:hypothetical protein